MRVLLMFAFYVCFLDILLSKEAFSTQECGKGIVKPETLVKVGFQRIYRAFQQITNYINQLMNFPWIIKVSPAIISVFIVSSASGEWKTIIKPFKEKGKNIKSRLDEAKSMLNMLIEALKGFSKKDESYAGGRHV